MTIELTPRTAAAGAHYADLVGISPQKFLNAFLSEFLVARFADEQTGNAEPFLVGFTFKDRGKAERLADWITERLSVSGSRDTLEVEIVELPTGSYKVHAALISDGRMHEICC